MFVFCNYPTYITERGYAYAVRAARDQNTGGRKVVTNAFKQPIDYFRENAKARSPSLFFFQPF